MSEVNLNAHEISNMPGQRAGTRLSLGDVFRLCTDSDLVSDLMLEEDRGLTSLELQAVIKLAYDVARRRGSHTIEGLTEDEMLARDQVVCPLTLRCDRLVLQAQILNYYDYHCPEAPSCDFLAQMLGVLPLSLLRRSQAKCLLANLVPFDGS